MTTTPDDFERALEALLDGDVSALAQALEAQPQLVTARAPWSVPPWDGYFHHRAAAPPIEPTEEVSR